MLDWKWFKMIIRKLMKLQLWNFRFSRANMKNRFLFFFVLFLANCLKIVYDNVLTVCDLFSCIYLVMIQQFKKEKKNIHSKSNNSTSLKKLWGSFHMWRVYARFSCTIRFCVWLNLLFSLYFLNDFFFKKKKKVLSFEWMSTRE